jgi:diguanylate cyclase (GGDEF)-like protein/PAS domain S-box-containing protein
MHVQADNPRRNHLDHAVIAVFLVVAAVLVGGFFWPSSDNDLGWFSDVSLTTVSVTGGLVTLLVARFMKGRDRLSWTLIGAGILAWGFGQAAWTYMELVLGMDRPFPSLADAGYMLMIPLMFAGLITLPGNGRQGHGRLTIGLDAFIIMACVATVSWFGVLGPIYVKADVSWAEKFFGLVYPAGDVLLLFALIGGLARGWFARRNPVVAPLMLGIGLFITADLGFAALTVNNTYQSGSLIDLGWPLGFLFATFAAVLRWTRGEDVMRNDAVGESSRRLDSVLRLAPYPLILGVMALLFVSGVLDRPIDQNVFVALALMTVVLVLVRQFVTLRENERLNEDLKGFSLGLEDMVEERTTRLAALHDLAAGLCGAASVEQVCDIGLRAVCSSVNGRSAVLYLHNGEGWAPSVGYPEIPDKVVAPTDDIVARLGQQEVVCTADGTSGLGTIWVPASDRGQVYGFIAVLQGELKQAVDTKHLATIGAEFGIAFEDQRRFEAAYRNEARFRSLVQNSSESITVVDADGIVRYHSQAAQRVFGDDIERVLGTAWTEMLHEDDRAHATALLAEVAANPGTTTAGEWRRQAFGGYRYVETLATNLLDDPSVQGIVLNSRDITEHKALEEQLTHQAFHDSLTTLANRALFHDRVEHALARSQRTGQPLAVLFLDLDNFKTVNDSLGHIAGDQLLVGIAARVNSCVRAGDTVARLGGDEFAVLLEEVRGGAEATEVADRMDLALRAPFHLDGKDVFITGSTGIAFSNAASTSADEVLRNADVAMYTAKERGKARYVTFEPDMHAAVVRRLDLEADLRRAVDRDEFLVYYQPLFELRSGRMTGVEALVRWQHPERGIVSPLEFIPVAEETGLILPLGRMVLKQACTDVRDWQRRFPDTAPQMVNVNLSGRQLQQPGLVDEVAAILRDSGLSPSSLALEITESVLMADAASAVIWLQQLKALGVQIAVDDFGTGYSSLSYLQQFPVDTLKIDKSFVDGIGGEVERTALVGAIIELGRTLGLKTVAEGIEQPGQAAELTLLGCDVGQGYLYARPMDHDRLEEMLEGAGAEELRAAS